MGLRRKGREIAMQALYADGSNQHRVDENLRQIAENDKLELDSPIVSFAKELTTGVVNNLDQIDRIIIIKSKNWAFSRISPIDKALLRLGIYELLFTQVPRAVVINEALEIAKVFSSESSGKFINGILNQVNEDDCA